VGGYSEQSSQFKDYNQHRLANEHEGKFNSGKGVRVSSGRGSRLNSNGRGGKVQGGSAVKPSLSAMKSSASWSVDRQRTFDDDSLLDCRDNTEVSWLL